MTLFTRIRQACNGRSMTEKLLCLPGFMGSGADFNRLRRCLGMDPEASPWQWPDAHGHANIASYADHCWQAFQPRTTEPFYLYAYSMGGRIALHWLDRPELHRHCRGIFIAAAHPGLTDNTERNRRRADDALWAQRFRSQPLTETLQQWYQQPVFASLSTAQKQALIAEKSVQDPERLAQQLLTASLAGQADLSDRLQSAPNTFYIVGANDVKFLQLSASVCAPEQRLCIADAGHIVHVEQPKPLAAALTTLLDSGEPTE